MKINCIAVDDEPLALDIMRDYCERLPFVSLQHTFDNAIETLEYLRNNQVDLLLLDIQMEGLTGLQLLKAMRHRPFVILTTAYDEYALEGFELDVTDYLLKPISFERFVKAMNKVYDRMQNSGSNVPLPLSGEVISNENKDKDFIFIKTETRIEKVKTSDILYVEGMGDYWRIVTAQKRIMTLMNARGIEEALPFPHFCRVHKSWFVSLDKIDFVERRHIVIANQRIPISDSYQKAFFELIGPKS